MSIHDLLTLPSRKCPLEVGCLFKIGMRELTKIVNKVVGLRQKILMGGGVK